MKSTFTISFDSPKKIYVRKYKFTMNFSNLETYEQALDWAETSDDILSFMKDMHKYSFHEVSFDPAKEFYGFYLDNANPKDYIKIVDLWKDFFIEHDIDCEDIIEVIEDKQVI